VAAAAEIGVTIDKGGGRGTWRLATAKREARAGVAGLTGLSVNRAKHAGNLAAIPPIVHYIHPSLPPSNTNPAACYPYLHSIVACLLSNSNTFTMPEEEKYDVLEKIGTNGLRYAAGDVY
jgi:predicted amidohydrolase